eukprot:jgi/Botrbrau1/23431/Bobra.0051s0072.1
MYGLIQRLSSLISWVMEGRLILCGPESYFGVDFWRNCPDKTVVAYFLTHFHTDHIQGLRSNWNLGPLYCSDETCKLLRRRWPTFPGSIHILEAGVPLVIHVSDDIQIQVTPLHAEHCLGSLMYLIDGSFGRILHTGDFRWELNAQPRLLSHPALSSPPVDLLLIDNTYCHPRYQHPARVDACKEIIKVVSSYPGHAVVMGIDSLGKEELLAAVAGALGAPICIPPERLEAIRMLHLPLQLFTTDLAATRIRVMPRNQVTGGVQWQTGTRSGPL